MIHNIIYQMVLVMVVINGMDFGRIQHNGIFGIMIHVNISNQLSKKLHLCQMV